MPMTRLYLVLCTIISFVSGIFLTTYYNNLLLIVGTLLIVALIHGIAWANFKIHYKPLHNVIFQVLA